MAGESINFPITADDRASSKFRDVGRAAADAGAKIDFAAGSLKLWDDTTQRQAKASKTSTDAAKATAKAFEAVRAANAGVNSEFDKSIRYLQGQSNAFDDVAKAAEKAAGSGGSTGLSSLIGNGGVGGGGLVGVAIAAGALAAPALVTLGFGLSGLGAAAYGIYKPISNAAQATGGLTANLHKLNPEQQQVARGILALGKTFAGFQNNLQPTVLGDFDKALQLARTLLHDIEPVASATGKGLAGVIGSITATFQDGTWQQFFSFMARTAGPDIALVGKNFTDLLNALPPLLEQLQPVSEDFLHITDGAAQLIGALAKTNQSLDGTGQHMNTLQHITATLRTLLFSPGAGLGAALKLLHVGGADAGKGLDAAAGGAQTLVTPAQDAAKELQAMATSTTNLMKAQQTALNTQVTYGGDLVTQANDAHALEAALDKSHDKIGLQTAAQRNSFSTANQYITDLGNTAQQAYASGHGVDASISAISHGLPILDQAKTKNRQYWQEVQTLVGWLNRLRNEKAIRETVYVSGSGTFTVRPGSIGLPGGTAGGPFPQAAGGMIPGSGNRDTFPALLTPGEVVVPKRMVSAGAVDHLRGSLPGFAAGGLVGNYSGSVGGLVPWSRHDLNATVGIFEQSMAKATLAGIKAAQSAVTAGGPGNGGAVEALARRMFPWPGYMWTDFALVENREAGWNIHAQNPSSGAYGLAQFINGPSEYYQWGGNPNTAAGQLTGMFNYIRSRYGDPLRAWGHELSYGWYDRGGALKPGWNLAYNGTGRPEMVVPNSRGGTQTIVLEIAPGAEGGLTAALMQVLRKQIRVRGGGDVQLALGRI